MESPFPKELTLQQVRISLKRDTPNIRVIYLYDMALLNTRF